MRLNLMLLATVLVIEIPAMFVLAQEPSTKPAATKPSVDAKLSAAWPAQPDLLMGIYQGTWPSGGQATKAEVHVFPDDDQYRAVLSVPPPADGPSTLRIELTGKAEGGKIAFAGKDKAAKEWSGKLEDGKLRLSYTTAGGGVVADESVVKSVFERIVRTSPAELLKPPADAVVLLPVADGPPSLEAWANTNWQPLPGGVMQAAKGDNRTRQAFGDIRLHVEFRIPYQPKGHGQGRGNSGVYLQDRYEVQVLDSFGLLPRGDECGAVYGVSAPRVNACLPPMSWQTYDLLFKAPRVGADGKPVPGWITVRQNGVLIHDKAQIKSPTRSAGASGAAETGPLKLQDHGHPVQFRNIWLVELKDVEAATLPADKP